MTSAQPTEEKKLEPAEDTEDFDAATDLCDFGFVLAPPKPAPGSRPGNLSFPK